MVISTRQPQVIVEYTTKNGKRVERLFTDAYAARRFYTAQDKAGTNPAVKKTTDQQTQGTA